MSSPIGLPTAISGQKRFFSGAWALLVVSLIIGIVIGISSAQASEPVEAGYRSFSYGTTVDSTPTGEKPESKLWWNDGRWWGSLWHPSTNTYRIYWLDLANQTWVATGTVLDDRPSSKADALWDQSTGKLYVVSHIFRNRGEPTSRSRDWGRLYRYTYNGSTKTYTLDTGFPVDVTRGRSETLTVDKDSNGKLWVTYVEERKVMVNRSTGPADDDLVWGEPFALPAKNATGLDTDDISAVIAFQGNKIGVMWSNQVTSKMYFAFRRDGDPDDVWQAEETALPGPNCSGDCADDHINLAALLADGSGRVFAAIKTSLSASNAPMVMLLERHLKGNNWQWDSHVFGRKSDKHTRPIVLLDEAHGRIHMFATAPESGGVIYHKEADLNNIDFSLGRGTPFIESSKDLKINNATSTKQNLNSSTGLLVLASDADSRYYLHNYISLSSNSNNPPPSNDPPPSSSSFTFLPTDDAYVNFDRPTSNYGSATDLRIRKTSSKEFRTHLKFSVADVGAITQAKLRLFVTDPSPSGGSIYQTSNNYAGSTTPWNESGLVWDNAPELVQGPLASVGPIETGTWVEFDVSEVVKDNGTYSFVIISSSSTSGLYSSKEGGQSPELVVVAK